MNHPIFVWTEPTPPGGFPAFVNISRDAEGRHTITVRARGNAGRDVATAEIPVQLLESLLCDLAADLYRDDPAGVAVLGHQKETSADTDERFSAVPKADPK